MIHWVSTEHKIESPLTFWRPLRELHSLSSIDHTTIHFDFSSFSFNLTTNNPLQPFACFYCNRYTPSYLLKLAPKDISILLGFTHSASIMAEQTSQPAPRPLQALDENLQNLTINNANHKQHGSKKVLSGLPESGALPAECAEEKNGSPPPCISPATPKATTLENFHHGQHGQVLTPSSSQGFETMVFFEHTDVKSADNTTKTRDPKQLVTFKLTPGKMGAGSAPMASHFPLEHAPVLRFQGTFDNSKVPTAQLGKGSFLAFSQAHTVSYGPQTLADGNTTAESTHDGVTNPVPHLNARAILDPSTTLQVRDTFENQYTALNGHLKQADLQKDPYPFANTQGLPAAYNQHEYPPSTIPFQADQTHHPFRTTFTANPLHQRIPSLDAHSHEASKAMGSTRDQTSPQRFKYATNIKELEQAADSAKRQNIFSDTKPGWSSDVTDITNWQKPAWDGASSLQPAQASPPRRPASSAKFQPVADPVGWRDARLGPRASFDPAAGNNNNNNGGPSQAPHQPAAGGYDDDDGSPSITNNRLGARPHNRQFEPMVCVQNPAKANEMLNGSEILHRLRHGISLNYKGQSHNLNNISRDIPHSENTALWLTNLPPAVTVKDLLGAIASCGPIGRVWSLHINPPKKVPTPAPPPSAVAPAAANQRSHHLQQGKINNDPNLPLSYRTSAAKLIFYQPAEAQRLLALAQRGAFTMSTTTANNNNDNEQQRQHHHHQQYQVHATHNRQRVPAQRTPNPTSRVLLISGPSWYVTEAQLHDLFRHFFVYQTEAVIVLAEDAARRVLEWRFGSTRAQAQAAFRLLKSPWLANIMVHVAWGTDPCETGANTG